MRAMKIGMTSMAVLVAMVAQSQAAIIVHTSDFILDSNRSHFNGFEAIPTEGTGTLYTGGMGPYTEDTIQVQQINGSSDTYPIWVTYSSWPGNSGSKNWYPNGGDNGYTQLTLTGGIDFQDVGFNYGGGSNYLTNILFELLDNGIVVKSGLAALNPFGANYLGFSGGGFDTIRMRGGYWEGAGTVTDGSSQSLAIDNIETQDAQVPEPGSIVAILSLVSFGAGAVVVRRRKGKKRAA